MCMHTLHEANATQVYSSREERSFDRNSRLQLRASVLSRSSARLASECIS